MGVGSGDLFGLGFGIVERKKKAGVAVWNN